MGGQRLGVHTSMDSILRKQIVKEWVGNLPRSEHIVALAEKVRDIPYGVIGSREPQDVYERNQGTCSGKHELLKELYHELGIQTQDYIAMHRFKDLPVVYPQNLKTILERSDIIDPHNFFKIQVGGKWILVDITWDKPLQRVGFTVNKNWDDKTDMQLTVKPFEIIQTDTPLQIKEERLSTLSSSVQEDRKLFLKELSSWLAAERMK